MPQAQAAAGPIAGLTILRRFRTSANRVPLTVIVCLVLICGSFTSAALIQMRNDRARALSQAAEFGTRRAQEMAADLSTALDGYAAIGRAFANAATNPETSAALSEAGGAALRNIVVLDASGTLQSEMLKMPGDLLPLDTVTIAGALHGKRMAFGTRDGRSLVLLFAADRNLVLVEVDAAYFFRGAGMAEGALAAADGRLLALGTGWREAPDAATLALGHRAADSRIADLDSGARLLSLAKLSHWPLTAVASHPTRQALGAWYGALPLYLFFILGPSFAGAALAAVFVRLFEREARAAAALQSLRCTRAGEARLLVRLADAERRAAEAERAKARFIAQVSHELRTPLNAIIGFAETIESGVFGAPHVKYGEYARDIAGAGRELHAKIGSVLEYAALENPRGTSPKEDLQEPVDISEIARRKIAERASLAQVRGLKLVVSAPDAAFARGDAGTVARILGHLLDNALGYTPKGGTVRVEIRADAREVVVGVRDTGEGFSTAERLHAGEAFQRFPRNIPRGGMGMGLAIAMGLARRMGATLSLSSVPGDGTLALLRLAAIEKNKA